MLAGPRLKKHVRLLTGAALFAAALVWLPLGRWLPSGSSGEMRISFLEYVYLPTLLPAALLGCATHAGERAVELLLWIATTVQTYAMVSLVSMLLGWRSRRASARSSGRDQTAGGAAAPTRN